MQTAGAGNRTARSGHSPSPFRGRQRQALRLSGGYRQQDYRPGAVRLSCVNAYPRYPDISRFQDVRDLVDGADQRTRAIARFLLMLYII